LAPATSAAEETIENITKPEVAKIKIGTLARLTALAKSAKTFKRIATAITTDTSVAKLVIALALAGVFEHFVGLIDFFEFGLISTPVRVVLNSSPAKGLF
jgi:hypothetical protein